MTSIPNRLVVCASHSPGKERDVTEQFGTEFRSGLRSAAAIVEEFDPELVVLFGGDHRRAFRHVVPTFGVALSASITEHGSRPTGDVTVPGGQSRSLAEYLLARDFDIAVCRDIGLDHAFAQPLYDLLGGIDIKPVIPIAVNCATAPLPTAARVAQFGSAVGGYLDTLDERVLVIGTGGLSHSPPSLEVDAYEISDDVRARLISEGMAEARTKIRPDWDRQVLAAFADADQPALLKLVDNAHAAAGAGANEVRTWLAAAAAGGSHPLHPVVYQPVPEWITGMAVAVSH
ncbi:2,3-dihydroxyphenylpropionate/2,3-dihydroxicinnam ic acid 1,2-dioxygenase [Mycolicibacterium anyangense]|jgi:2,3-dihydroxyphenylpropionate 1,2-dioxygenase|uniref:2,3-dihydroxyphenylpropionate/2,3-dihydroxicinnam ic acid 1,2-dioxygenase n=1 Tax=Mycolicibacterium anyangense TaxID=1431246 RepID=A0A6N4W8N6_9MYCO|nr:3-carboxyethylcatechol 2,3-dioxygenase [Mycolicibacterium anyangense]BBZ77115.1 2,3-dihydroxyphenylpropionate/2,3-dihydroxicinnam ic acid 1,2-dioxygenase [Mycolicibacterium anyangense]